MPYLSSIRLGEGCLPAGLFVIHVCQVEQQRYQARLRLAAHPPVVVGVVLLPVLVGHHLAGGRGGVRGWERKRKRECWEGKGE
jgi:hypothetical protein